MLTPLTLITALLPLLSLADAAHNPPHLRHRRLAADTLERLDARTEPVAQLAPRSDTAHAKAKRAITGAVQKRGPKQHCRARNAAASAPASASSSSSSSPISSSSAVVDKAVAPSKAPAPAPTSKAADPTTSSESSWVAPSSTSTTQQAAPSPQAPPSDGNSGVLSMSDGPCGWCGSSNDAPNGSEDWLNCGLNGGGWTPPHLTLDKLIYQPLDGHGVFGPCKDYFWAFEQFGAQYNVPPILLASFAMQESTCNPGATGGNGEAGLMQIAQPNCWGAPGGNCYDLAFNVERGAKIFSDLVNANNGNVLIAAGGYNGWRKGMTANDGMAAKWQGNCHAQNNLDYLHQLFNGWIQGRNGYSMGSYFNLKDC